MAKLSPGSTPGNPVTGRKYPVNKPASKPENKSGISFNEACDQCGYSRIDGHRISRARAQIEVKPDKFLYLCDHHTTLNAALILERGYDLRKLA